MHRGANLFPARRPHPFGFGRRAGNNRIARWYDREDSSSESDSDSDDDDNDDDIASLDSDDPLLSDDDDDDVPELMDIQGRIVHFYSNPQAGEIMDSHVGIPVTWQ